MISKITFILRGVVLMKISMATANFYKLPFIEALDIIARAGYEYIELDEYWKGGNWEVAQHLKGVSPKDVVKAVKDSGLKISVLHDLGGLIEESHNSIISDSTYEYLELVDIPCISFHTPHKQNADINWWNNFKEKTIKDLEQVSDNKIITIENLMPLENYFVPLLNPNEMYSFLEDTKFYCTFDTTHYAQSGIDILYAATILHDKIRTIHLSDYLNGKSHVYIGDGELDFCSFFSKVNLEKLFSMTIECALPMDNKNEAIRKSIEVRRFVERFRI